LRDEPAVELRVHRVLRDLDVDIDIGIANALKKHDLADRIGHVFGRHHWLGHASKAGEFVHHAFDVVDLADDSVGALLEDAPVILDHAGILAP
jgi:hypothetical protein